MGIIAPKQYMFWTNNQCLFKRPYFEDVISLSCGIFPLVCRIYVDHLCARQQPSGFTQVDFIFAIIIEQCMENPQRIAH